MSEWLVPYAPVLAAVVTMGAIYVVQMLVADVAGIRGGHVPGMPVAGGHDQFLFRAVRAQANTNESLALFALVSVAAVLVGADPSWAAWLTWAFVLARIGHMAAYYVDLRAARSAAFAVGLAALAGLVVLALLALA